MDVPLNQNGKIQVRSCGETASAVSLSIPKKTRKRHETSSPRRLRDQTGQSASSCETDGSAATMSVHRNGRYEVRTAPSAVSTRS